MAYPATERGSRLVTYPAWLLISVVGACSVYDPALLRGAPGQLLSPSTAGASGHVSPEPGPVLDSSGLTGDAGKAMDPDTPSAPPPKVDAATPEDVQRCGDGKITGTEKCDIAIADGKDGACPKECERLEKCVPRAVTGTACEATCVLRQLLCEDGDGCCPGNCTPQNDKDCSSQCGDKDVDKNTETCEPGTDKPCITSAAECDDKNACTTDMLLGSAKNCNTSCAHSPVGDAKNGDGCCPTTANANTDNDCKPKCGNNVKETGEECDGGMTCNAMCKMIMLTDQQKCMAMAKDACDNCACMNCAADEVACRMSANADFNMKCSAILECARKNNCTGAACLGTSTMPGPCQAEIEVAAGTDNPLLILTLTGDLMTPVGRSTAIGNCVSAACPTACRITMP